MPAVCRASTSEVVLNCSTSAPAASRAATALSHSVMGPLIVFEEKSRRRNGYDYVDGTSLPSGKTWKVTSDQHHYDPTVNIQAIADDP